MRLPRCRIEKNEIAVRRGCCLPGSFFGDIYRALSRGSLAESRFYGLKLLSFCYVCGKVNLVLRRMETGAVDARGSVWELI